MTFWFSFSKNLAEVGGLNRLKLRIVQPATFIYIASGSPQKKFVLVKSSCKRFYVLYRLYTEEILSGKISCPEHEWK